MLTWRDWRQPAHMVPHHHTRRRTQWRCEDWSINIQANQANMRWSPFLNLPQNYTPWWMIRLQTMQSNHIYIGLNLLDCHIRVHHRVWIPRLISGVPNMPTYHCHTLHHIATVKKVKQPLLSIMKIFPLQMNTKLLLNHILDSHIKEAHKKMVSIPLRTT